MCEYGQLALYALFATSSLSLLLYKVQNGFLNFFSCYCCYFSIQITLAPCGFYNYFNPFLFWRVQNANFMAISNTHVKAKT